MSKRVAREPLTFAIVSIALAGATHCSLVLSDLPDPVDPVPASGAASHAGAGGVAGAGRGALEGGASGTRAAGGASAHAGYGTDEAGAAAGGEAGLAEGGSSGTATATGGTGGSGPRGGESSGGGHAAVAGGGAPTGGGHGNGARGGSGGVGGSVAPGGAGGTTSNAGSGAAAGAGGSGGGAGKAGAGGSNGGGNQGGRGGTSAGDGGTGQTGGSAGAPPPECDADHDGHDSATRAGCHGDDCDDADADVHPGQVSYFSVENAAGNYDYDCNGEEEPLIATAIDCAGLLGACSGEGFDGSVPACGKTGAWVRCEATIAPLPALCDAVENGTKPQACR